MAFVKNSFLDDFEIPEITHNAIKEQLVKLGKVASVSAKSVEQMPLSDRLAYITKEVYSRLGRYRNFVKVIDNERDLELYIDKAISKGYLALDTETNRSLDPLTCKLMGLCLYIPNTRPVYVPVSHTEPGTDTLLKNQVSLEFVAGIFKKLKNSDIKIIYHNGKFDIRVCYNTTGVYLPIWWDTMIASQLLDENKPAGLKFQYTRFIDATIGTYNIESLFTGLKYEYVPVDVFALYSAIDAYDTYRLQQYQQKLFEEEGMERLYNLFQEVEVPIVLVTAEMEDSGINLDLEFLGKLETKFSNLKNYYLDRLNECCKPYEGRIRYEQSVGRLDDPVNFDSSTQLSYLLYDVMDTPVIPKFGKSTESDALTEIDTEFTKAILKYRHFGKLISGFTQPLPSWLSPRDGKLHASFNQMGREDKGVRTGRFSSTDPNLQQIPSHEKTMRLAFKASPGCVIVGSDYSAQEPRLMTHLSGDETLRDTFENNRDPYATLCAPAFHLDYWDCMEHHQDGSPNPDGKKMRAKGKVLMLGISYGMGAKNMSTKMGIPQEECEQVLANFYETFPKIKAFSEKNRRDVETKGYVEDYMGRRRHLPDASLPEIEITQRKAVDTNADVFLDVTSLGTKGDPAKVFILDKDALQRWTQEFNRCDGSRDRFRAMKNLRKSLKDNDISFTDNSSRIAKTRTQCTNARIQGSAATLTKRAMVAISSDERMRELGFKLLIPVHDELLGECPEENAEEVSQRLSELMVNATKPEVSVKFKCDPYITKHWYADEVENEIYNEYYRRVNGGEQGESVISSIINKYPEISPDVVRDMCLQTFDLMSDRI